MDMAIFQHSKAAGIMTSIRSMARLSCLVTSLCVMSGCADVSNRASLNSNTYDNLDSNTVDGGKVNISLLRGVSTIYVQPVVASPQKNLTPEMLTVIRKEIETSLPGTVGVTVLDNAKSSPSSADATLTIYITDYAERVGGSAGATEGARISARAELLSPSGKQIWANAFSYNDRPLTDNLLAFSKSAGSALVFSSGAELQQTAIDSLLSDLAAARNRSFLVVK